MAIPFPSVPPQSGRERPGLDPGASFPRSAAVASPAQAAPTHSRRETTTAEWSLARQAEQEQAVALVARCAAGDQFAWQQLVTREHSRVYGICFRFLGNRAAAEDATQDVFLKVYRNLRSFDPTKGSLQTWMTTLTRNLLVDGFRRSRLDRATGSLDVSATGENDGPTLLDRLPDHRPNQEQRVAGLELKARIQHALTQISPELREAVILRDLEDMDYKEIASVLNIPEGTVKSRISRGRRELGRMLQRMEGQVV